MNKAVIILSIIFSNNVCKASGLMPVDSCRVIADQKYREEKICKPTTSAESISKCAESIIAELKSCADVFLNKEASEKTHK